MLSDIVIFDGEPIWMCDCVCLQ